MIFNNGALGKKITDRKIKAMISCLLRILFRCSLKGTAKVI